jgi:hypothetical protein
MRHHSLAKPNLFGFPLAKNPKAKKSKDFGNLLNSVEELNYVNEDEMEIETTKSPSKLTGYNNSRVEFDKNSSLFNVKLDKYQYKF